MNEQALLTDAEAIERVAQWLWADYWNTHKLIDTGWESADEFWKAIFRSKAPAVIAAAMGVPAPGSQLEAPGAVK